MTDHNAAKNRIRVRVEMADIQAGVRRDCAECPVARAVSRALGLRCLVGNESIVTADNSPKQRFQISPALWKRIDQFDVQGFMRPFTFTLNEV